MGVSYLAAMKATEKLEGLADELRIFITARELTDESDTARICELESDYKRSIDDLRKTVDNLENQMRRAWEF